MLGNQISTLTHNVQNLTAAVATMAQTVTSVVATNQSNIADLANTIGQMNMETGHTASASIDKTFITKPTPFNGKCSGAEAQHFLAAFSNWAMSTGKLLNDRDTLSGKIIANDEKWIQSVLNFLTDDARSWALSHLEKIANGEVPFRCYLDFMAAFRKRFKPVDGQMTARDIIKHLKQNTLLVAQYKAKFNEQSPRTNWSDSDLREQFYDNLSSRIKDMMVYMDDDIFSLNGCYKVALRINTRIWAREAEKAGKLVTSMNLTNRHTATPAADSNAMDIDATRMQSTVTKTIGEWNKHMVGKCNRCGLKDHKAKDGNHNRDVCNWCLKAGHRSSACMGRFFGNARVTHPAQQATASATITEVSPTSSTSPATTGKPSTSPATALATTHVAPPSTANIYTAAEFEKQVAEMRKEMDAIKAAFA